ncbi:MAG: hypothetical protein QW487_07915 [Candidatus Bathyarchaeia archaeon]|nr:hypothetical protein [Candidatus Bathyarchaeota archaeon]
MSEKYFEVYGIQLNKGILRFGKYFYSEKHAKRYAQERKKSIASENRESHSGCCC